MSSSKKHVPPPGHVVDQAWLDALARETEEFLRQQESVKQDIQRAKEKQAEWDAQARKVQQKVIFGEDYISTARRERMRALLCERNRRRNDALKLYEPLVSQAAFHASNARVRLLRGSNRGGKTLPAAAEVAIVARGLHPRYQSGGVRIVCVGRDLKHIAKTMWAKLNSPGPFTIIRDEETQHWRAFRPWLESDLARIGDARMAPPLIPDTLIKELGWHDRKERQVSVCRLHNGSEISFYSGEGKPPRGIDVDLVWIDEEVEHPDWFPEMSSRILDRNGQLIWSATPQSGTVQLYELHERAMALLGEPNPDVEEFVVLIEDNPHISNQVKKEWASTLTPDQYKVRVRGDFEFISHIIFPEFQHSIHVVEPAAIPPDWTLYASVDPGRQVCAVAFAAVSPPGPDRVSRVLIYDELYIRDGIAEDFGRAMRAKCAGKAFEAFIIDYHGSIKHDIGSGMTEAQHYAAALKRHGVKCRQSGHYLIQGSDDLDGGIEAMKEMLRLRGNGTPQLQVSSQCQMFLHEIKRYRNAKDAKGNILKKPDKRQPAHMMDAWRYLAMFGPKWYRPQRKRVTDGGVAQILKSVEKYERASGQPSGGFMRLGPGGSR